MERLQVLHEVRRPCQGRVVGCHVCHGRCLVLLLVTELQSVGAALEMKCNM